jgi:hypothetical protein
MAYSPYRGAAGAEQSPSGLPTLGPDGTVVGPAPAPVPIPYPAPPTHPAETPPQTTAPGRHQAASELGRRAAPEPGRRAASEPGRRRAARTAYSWWDVLPAVRQAIGVFVVLLIGIDAVVAVASAAWLPDGLITGPGDWASASVLLIAVGLGGALTVPGVATAHVMPVLLSLMVLLPIVMLARREERRRPAAGLGALLARSAAGAVTLAVVIGAAGAVVRYEGYPGGPSVLLSGPLRIALVWTVPAVLVVVSLVSFTARLTAPPVIPKPVLAPMSVRISSPFSLPTPAVAPTVPARPAADAVRLVVRFAALVTAGAAILAVVLGLLVVTLVVLRTSAAPENPFALADIVIGVSLVPTAVLVMLGVPFAVAERGDLAVGLVTDPGPATLLLVLPLLAVLPAAIWHTLARPVATWQASYRPAGLVRVCATAAVVAAAVALSQRISLSVAGGSENALGPSVPGAAIAGLLWGALLVAALRVSPAVALLMPRLMLALPGRVHPTWAAVLVGLEPAPTGTGSRHTPAG